MRKIPTLLGAAVLALALSPKSAWANPNKTCSIVTTSGGSFTCSPPIPSNVFPTASGGTLQSAPSGWGLGPIFMGTNTLALDLTGSSGGAGDTVLLIVVPTNLVGNMTFQAQGGMVVAVNASNFVAAPMGTFLPGAASINSVYDNLPLIGVSTSAGLSIAFVDLGVPLTNGLQVMFTGLPKGTVIYAYGATNGALVLGTPNSGAAVFNGAQVPEPVSSLLLGTGFLGLAGMLRKRKASRSS